ncbi:MAG: DNA-processing protein DprA [Peptostreptococcus porci]|uniref:DNA-processing protein DprA n=1 Tax=Peptostreptococcus porci TaxID=2652282 RepID=UPI002A748185|nr:DNA-processing protein DprA [Peptostreptococcus porci]MDY2794777.1 DNA-processing protein DprA [Peptostreptococcus porci]MDY4561335.1 DNA-processing protein DprA [Peptostreptococcus porci]
MKFSDIAIKVWAAKESGLIRTNAEFWSKCPNRREFDEKICKDPEFSMVYERLYDTHSDNDSDIGIICAFDEDFPYINPKVKNKGDKPFLIFYRGDLSLLSDLNKNVAVIGLTNPEEEIQKREREIVKRLVNNELIIVSGLAEGCDSIAHKVAVDMGGKTIAILPSNISKVYPAGHREFAEEIVGKGGLLISEYYKEPATRNESLKRFIERDRLQAMFSKAIILISSYRKGEGDSGSRHAMESAKKYGIDRFAMFNQKTDSENPQFGLNRDYLSENVENRTKVLMTGSINDITSLYNPDLDSSNTLSGDGQISFKI